jgi:predicted nucleotidyltransferase component of viral defense system
MNKNKLTSICHKVSKESGVTFNSAMLYYFLESILKRLSKGKYSKNFIFKGGFLLSNVVGIESRSTMDIDFLLRNIKLSEENISEMLRESLKEIEGDAISYEIKDITPIKEVD